MIRAIITDIEGTTTSIAFVYEVLFPYARSNMHSWIQEHGNDVPVKEQLALVNELSGRSLTLDHAADQLLQWMDEDKKITPLKTLQGLIWEHGYRQADFKGHIYDDVPPNLQAWHDQGISLYVYSSGSVQAQKLLFSHTDHGDLSVLFKGWFDTRIGQKKESRSYERIAGLIGFPAEQILFLSDTEAELEAAKNAGMKTLLLDREGNKQKGKYPSVRNFNEINTAQQLNNCL